MELINSQKPSFRIVKGNDLEDTERAFFEQAKELNKKGFKKN